MRYIKLLLLVALLALSTDAAAQQTAVRFGRLWDGSRTVVDAVVVVEAGRVVRVGSGPKDVPAGAEVVDLRRYTGLPGLIDLHTHMTYFWDRQPATRPLGQRRRPAVTVFLAQDNAQADARKRRDDGPRSGASSEHRLRDARSDCDGRDDRSTHDRGRTGDFGARANRHRPRPGGDARRDRASGSRPARTGSRSTARAAASTASRRRRR